MEISSVARDVLLPQNMVSFMNFFANGRDSFQLFVAVFDICLVWYLLVLPSETHAVASMTS